MTPALAGRQYLSPEPMLQEPEVVRDAAQQGQSLPTYAYAANNPLSYIDPSGLKGSGQAHDWAEQAKRYCDANPSACKRTARPHRTIARAEAVAMPRRGARSAAQHSQVWAQQSAFQREAQSRSETCQRE